MLKIIRERKKSLRVPMIIFVAVVSISLVGFFANWGAAPPDTGENDELEEVLNHQIAHMKEMIYEYEQDLEENPQDIDLIMNLADAKYRLAYFYSVKGDSAETNQQYMDCIELYKKVLQDDPQNFDANFGIAVSAMQVGEIELADEKYEKALELESENPLLFANYGVHRVLSHEDFEGALEYFEKGLALEPEDEGLKENLQMYISLVESELKEDND